MSAERGHILLVSYLFPPSDVSAVRRVVAFRNAFDKLGIRTTVLTSAVSGRAPDDERSGVIRARDLRAHIASQYQVLAGSKRGTAVSVNQRWWTRFIVPDVSVVSWLPAALTRAGRLVYRDRPDGVLTTSPPESVHLVGLALRRLGIPWIADLRDGWMFESPTVRSRLKTADRALERRVVCSADRVTCVTKPLVDDLQRRYGLGEKAVHVSGGFEPEDMTAASDERATLDACRFSLVYTGTGTIDGKDIRPFLRALTRIVGELPELREQFEVVFVGTFTDEEVRAIRSSHLAGVTRLLGRVEHRRALGLQRAADGLLLITSVGKKHVATGKLYEYLAASKPILALAEGNAAAELLDRAGGHISAPPEDEDAICGALGNYLATWLHTRIGYSARPDFRLEELEMPKIARHVADLFVDIGALKQPKERAALSLGTPTAAER
jgi:glycosyltransferase involved in cell wall biosynthesis